MKAVYFLLFIFFLFGCEQAPPADPYTHGQFDPSSTNQNTESPPEFGVLTCGEGEQPAFDVELQKFLSATIDPSTVPPVNCTGQENTRGAVYIKGRVNFENNAVFDPNSESQQLVVSNDSYLEIHIVDAHGKLFKGIKMKAARFSGGTVDGKFIVLSFEDNTGRVEMDGTIEEGIFFGPFKFENFTDFQGKPIGHKGQLGNFSIYPCSLLNCGDKLILIKKI